MALSELLGDASGLLENVKIDVIKTYDPSKNTISVAGLTLDGITSADITEISSTQAEVGVDQKYYTFYDVFSLITLTVNLLPTASCLTLMNKLDQSCKKNKATFTINVTENGVLLDNFRGHIMTLPKTSLNSQGDDKTIIFGLFKVANNKVERLLNLGDLNQYLTR